MTIELRAEDVTVTEDTLTAELSDGRTISVSLDWHPRQVHAVEQERGNWQPIGGGQGIRWRDLDEDINVEALVAGRSAGGSQRSFRRWLPAKWERRGLTLYELMPAEREAQQGN